MPHTRETTSPKGARQFVSAPGHITIVTVPDTRGSHEIDPLRPYTDTATISEVTTHLNKLSTTFAEIEVVNPEFEPITLDLHVALQQGLPFDSYRPILNEDLKRHLSPWAYEDSLLPDFGGSVNRSSLIAFIESLSYIDFITELTMTPAVPSKPGTKSLQQISPSSPASILTSAETHNISPVTTT